MVVSTTEGKMACTTSPVKTTNCLLNLMGRPPKCPGSQFATLPPRHEAQVKNTYPVDRNNSLEVPYFIRLCVEYLPCVLHKLASSFLCITSLVTRLRVVLSGSSPVDVRKGLVRIPTCAIFYKFEFAAEGGVPHSFVWFIRQ